MQRFLFDRLCEPLKHMPIDSHNKLLLLRVSIVEALQRLFTQRSFFEGIQSTGPNSVLNFGLKDLMSCLLYTSPSPRDGLLSRMPSSA